MKKDPVQRKGTPYPLGATRGQSGWNFAVHSLNRVEQLVIAKVSTPFEIIAFRLDPEEHRTGSVWHTFIELDDDQLYYGFFVNTGRQKDPSQSIQENNLLLIDPHARLIHSGSTFGKSHWREAKNHLQPLGMAVHDTSFDWQQDRSPVHRTEDLIIYEMHVRGFTEDPSSRVRDPGTYLGVVEKIPYLKELGINAIEFLPLQEFDETENVRYAPKSSEPLYNYWGYSPLSFFSPMQRYATSNDPIAAMHELKLMVRELHKADIEVLVDVVFNHTGEGNERGTSISWKGFADADYYLKGNRGEYCNFSGCGNTINCNHPIMADMVIDALRYWVTEFHVDGFRFDLASILTRGQDGCVLPIAPLLDRIVQDPVLSHRKLIAEPWDAGGVHQVGTFFLSGGSGPEQWMEWNDDFRKVVRYFLKGTDGFAGRFAAKLCGSEDQYGSGGGSPLNSLNYITCHDGFTLRDLVSYNHKHNEANGEDNRDGMDESDAWNSGVEGPSSDPAIKTLRERRMKNLCLALLVAQGVPMIHMGDEYGHTKMGNNNSWCHDSPINWFSWKELHAEGTLFRFWKTLIAFRYRHPILRGNTFLNNQDVEWHGLLPFTPSWAPQSRFVACTRKDHERGRDLYVAFNSYAEEVSAILPPPPRDMVWAMCVNTSAVPPQDILDENAYRRLVTKEVKMLPYSAIALIAQPK